MRVSTYGNFQVGILENPSIEDKGGFEFASGMDIFSEPGVLKACQKMKSVTLNGGLTLDGVLNDIDITSDTGFLGFAICNDKVIKSTDGDNWSTFLTNSNGAMFGLKVFNGYLFYASVNKLGNTIITSSAGKNDNFASLTTNYYHPLAVQGGTLKVGHDRYIASINEAFSFTSQAMKMPNGYSAKTLADHLSRLYIGSFYGNIGSGHTVDDATVFDWPGTVLSTGSALPLTSYPLKLRGMNAIYSDNGRLFAFPGVHGNVYFFNGIGFEPLRTISPKSVNDSNIIIAPSGVTTHESTILFGGDMTDHPGVFQMQGGAICQSFIPSQVTPGQSVQVQIGFVKSAFEGRVLIGYAKIGGGGPSYYLDISDTANKQTGSFIRTVWHREKTDKLKRWAGVKLDLKPLASGCSVSIGYRTERDASFTDSGYTITSTNQDKPVILAAQPRSREIQWKFTYTTNANNTPELLSYDNIFDVLNTLR